MTWRVCVDKASHPKGDGYLPLGGKPGPWVFFCFRACVLTMWNDGLYKGEQNKVSTPPSAEPCIKK